MAAFEFWVDPVGGSNANPGTESLPYATLYYANDANRKANGDTVTIYIKPTGSLQAADYIRIIPQNNASFITVKSATPGVNWTQTNSVNWFIGVFSQPTATLRIEDATVTCNRVEYFEGTNLLGNRTFSLELAGNCVFTHGRTNAEEAFRLIVPPAPNKLGSLKIEPGCTVNGWSDLFEFDTGALHTLDIDGLFADGNLAQTGSSTISCVVVKLKNSEISIPNASYANIISINASPSTLIEIENNDIEVFGTGLYALEVRAPLAGESAVCDLLIDNNRINSSGMSSTLKVGKDLIGTSTRVANKALVENFRTCIITNNDLVEANAAGGIGALGLFVGTDNAVVTGNYCRVKTLGTATNVHQVYLWGDGITFEDNLGQTSVLAFGEDQVIRGNVLVAYRCILLGGTQAGSTASGGGNNYTIRNNILISFPGSSDDNDDCYSDYAFNGAYPTNLGALVADIDQNKYVVMSGSNGLARLVNGASQIPTTLSQLQNVWQQSVTTGTGPGVWGDASNSDNDRYSKLIPESKVSDLVVAGAALTRQQLQQIKNRLTKGFKVDYRDVPISLA